MWTAYLLRSARTGKYYRGTSSNLQERLAAHNGGRVKSTKHGRPWKLSYREDFESKSDALRRERFFKTRSGHRWLKQNGIIE